ncbi:hypothetical protein M8J75_005610 [Diaphorina citri]|nr:hypothetical protein M8J75_005610 [Diaphorina citri]
MEFKHDNLSIISKLQAIEDKISGNKLKTESLESKRKNKTFHKDYVTWISSDEEKDEDHRSKKPKKRKSKLADSDCADDSDYEPYYLQTNEFAPKIKRGRGRPKKLKLTGDKVQSLLSLSKVLSKAELRNQNHPRGKTVEPCDKIKRRRGRPRKIEVCGTESESHGILDIEPEESAQGIFELSAEVETEDLLKEAELSSTALQALACVYQEDKREEGDDLGLGSRHPAATTPTSSTFTTPITSSNSKVHSMITRRNNPSLNKVNTTRYSAIKHHETTASEKQEVLGDKLESTPEVNSISNELGNNMKTVRSRARGGYRVTTPIKRKFQVTPAEWFTCGKCGTIFKFISTYRYHMDTECNTKAVLMVKQKEEKGYQCPQCPKQVATRTSLMVHLRLHSGERRFPCEYCSLSFYQKHHLKDHVNKIHLHPKTFSCNSCGQTWLGYTSWKQHVAACREKRRKETFPCKRCDERFSTRDELISHSSYHGGEERRYVCNHMQCTRRFHSASLLARHVSTHAIQYTCHMCGHMFTCKRRLTQHLARLHTGSLSYPCTQCPGKFYSAYELRQHVRQHTDERPFPCPVCQRTFRRKATMESHLMLHTGAKPYACTECDQKFNRNSKLKIHYNVAHCTGEMYECCHCARSFPCKSYLIPHLRVHTGEKPYACNLCTVRYLRSYELVLHLKKCHREDARNPYAPAFVDVNTVAQVKQEYEELPVKVELNEFDLDVSR